MVLLLLVAIATAARLPRYRFDIPTLNSWQIRRELNLLEHDSSVKTRFPRQNYQQPSFQSSSQSAAPSQSYNQPSFQSIPVSQPQQSYKQPTFQSVSRPAPQPIRQPQQSYRQPSVQPPRQPQPSYSQPAAQPPRQPQPSYSQPAAQPTRQPQQSYIQPRQPVQQSFRPAPAQSFPQPARQPFRQPSSQYSSSQVSRPSTQFSPSRGSQSCGNGQVHHAGRGCVQPIVTRNVFVFDAPKRQRVAGRRPVIPAPRIHRNIVFIRTPEVSGSDQRLIIPPTRHQTIVYVLSKNQEFGQQVLEIPDAPQTTPEVYFVQYNDGENPTLPGGINLQDALSRANVQTGVAVGGGSQFGGSGNLGGSSGGYNSGAQTQSFNQVSQSSFSSVGSSQSSGGYNNQQQTPQRGYKREVDTTEEDDVEVDSE